MSEEKTSSGAPPPAMADAGGKSRLPVAHPEPESSCPPSDLISASPSPRCTDAGAASETLVASPDCRSFSQLLAGAMASPAASPRAASTILSVPVVAVPCFLSPAAAVLDSPRFTFAMTHQAVLATVTAQAQMQIQAANSSSSTKLATSSQPVTTTINPVPLQQRVPHESKDNTFTPEVEQVHSSDLAPQSSQIVANTNSSDDGYNWRKYGQKQVKSSEDSRSYYKCTSVNCFAKKKVERCPDGRVTSVMYRGPHNHDPPQQTRCSRERGVRPGGPLGESESLNSPSCEINELDPSTSKTDQNYGNENREQQLFCSSDCEGDTRIKTEDDLGDEPNPKRRYAESTMTFSAPVKMYKEAKIVVHSTSDAGHASDGYKWRKYGQKFVKGNSNPRSYYRCTHNGCPVRKHVERASDDSGAIIMTYEGKHSHNPPSPRNSSDTPPLVAATVTPDEGIPTFDYLSDPKPPRGPKDVVGELSSAKALESAEALLSISGRTEPDVSKPPFFIENHGAVPLSTTDLARI